MKLNLLVGDQRKDFYSSGSPLRHIRLDAPPKPNRMDVIVLAFLLAQQKSTNSFAVHFYPQ
jgi:hypothetical protein